MHAGQQPHHGIEPVMSLAEVAAELGISRAGVQVIEKRALRKLRCILAERGCTPADLFEAVAQAVAPRNGSDVRTASVAPPALG